jgi:hypothetical protein
VLQDERMMEVETCAKIVGTVLVKIVPAGIAIARIVKVVVRPIHYVVAHAYAAAELEPVAVGCQTENASVDQEERKSFVTGSYVDLMVKCSWAGNLQCFVRNSSDVLAWLDQRTTGGEENEENRRAREPE